MSFSLVTGGSGFIGGHLVEALAAAGEQVRVLARPTSRTDHLETLGVDIVRGDLQDADSVAAASNGAHRIFHCGAVVTDWAPPGVFDAVNSKGTANVVAAATANDARLVHVSSTDVYGFPDKGGLDETTPRHRRGWGYVDAKISGEETVEAAIAAGELDAVIVRPASVYGPRCPYFVEGCAELLRNGALSFIDGGRATGGFIYVADLVRLIVLAGGKAQTGQIFNGTGGRTETWRDYFEGLAAVTGAPPITTNMDKAEAYLLAKQYEHRATEDPTSGEPPLTRHAWAMYATDQHFSVQKAHTQLGWAPETTLAQGFELVSQWWNATHEPAAS